MDSDTPPPDPEERPLDRAVLAALDPTPEPGPYPASLASLRARIAAGARTASTVPSPDRWRTPADFPRSWPRGVGGSSAWPWSAGAAALMAAAGFGVAFGVLRHGGRGPAAAGREYTTAAGQRLSVMLVDGTRLTLAPASRARVVGDREIDLEGEAFFAVVHNISHPFTVRTRGAIARDVGTSFDVRAYPEDVGARIAVVEGAVSVATSRLCGLAERPSPDPSPRAGRGENFSSRDKFLGPFSARGWAEATAPPVGPRPVGAASLRPAAGRCATEAHAGDVATVGDGGVAVAHRMDVASLTAWTEGRLVFQKTRFAEAARELGRLYDLDVRITEPALGVQEVTAEFSGDSLAEILTVLGTSLEARVERRGRTVMFTPKEGQGQ